MYSLKETPRINFNNQKCYRLIPSKFPPIDLFDDVANSDEFDALHRIQSITNPRLQNEVGDLNIVPSNEAIYNIPGAGYIMAAFTHRNPIGSRFSNGLYGVYYASSLLNTAIKETIYHKEKFLASTKEPAQDLDMRCLLATFNGNFINITKEPYLSSSLYNKISYADSQKFGSEVKINNHNGIYYNSVRSEKGKNFAILKPNIFKTCIQQAHYIYSWSGDNISHVYQKKLIL